MNRGRRWLPQDEIRVLGYIESNTNSQGISIKELKRQFPSISQSLPAMLKCLRLAKTLLKVPQDNGDKDEDRWIIRPLPLEER